MGAARKKRRKRQRQEQDSEFKFKMEKGLVGTIISVMFLFGGLSLAAVGVKKDSSWMIYSGIGSNAIGASAIGRKISRDSEETERERIYEETGQRLDATSYY